jgi:putative membrane protein
MIVIPYCGAPPLPGQLAGRWNGDLVLILILLTLAALHLRFAERRAVAAAGWTITALALLSPLCALSVSLFSARVAQHMILVLVAAPLVAAALPQGRNAIGLSAGAFCAALWFWHMPVSYDATFHSTIVYWAMHLSLFGSAVWLWRALLHHQPEEGLRALGAGISVSLAMGLLGAVITLSDHTLYRWHLLLTKPWGLGPLADQQLGGVLMWVPGCLLFLWSALRSIHLLWHRLEQPAVG